MTAATAAVKVAAARRGTGRKSARSCAGTTARRTCASSSDTRWCSWCPGTASATAARGGEAEGTPEWSQEAAGWVKGEGGTPRRDTGHRSARSCAGTTVGRTSPFSSDTTWCSWCHGTAAAAAPVAATETRAAATRQRTGRRSARSWSASTCFGTCAHASEASSGTRWCPCCPGTRGCCPHRRLMGAPTRWL